MITDKNINLLEITDKLKYVKNCLIKEEQFYFHLWNGIRKQNLFPYASYEDNKMTGCMVLFLGRDLNPGYILNLIFIWIDKHYPKLWKEYVEFAEEKAKEMGVSRLLINTKRNVKAIERKLGKYGYSPEYVIFEKEVK